MKLYELTRNYSTVWDMVDDDEQDIETLENTLEAIEGAIEEKAENISVFVKRLEAEEKAFKSEEDRLRSRRKTLEAKKDWLKKYLQSNMEAVGLNKINAGTFTVALQKSPASLVIEDEKAIEAEYITIIPEQYLPNKDAIKEALKAGKDVAGAKLVQGMHLRIR